MLSLCAVYVIILLEQRKVRISMLVWWINEAFMYSQLYISSIKFMNTEKISFLCFILNIEPMKHRNYLNNFNLYNVRAGKQT